MKKGAPKGRNEKRAFRKKASAGGDGAGCVFHCRGRRWMEFERLKPDGGQFIKAFLFYIKSRKAIAFRLSFCRREEKPQKKNEKSIDNTRKRCYTATSAAEEQRKESCFGNAQKRNFPIDAKKLSKKG